MDYKEKYEQALERARQFSEKPYLEDSAGIVEYIFPELAESEDERIRKDIISYVQQAVDSGYGIIPKERKEKWIAWLEKQGKQKPADKVEPKFKVGDWVVYTGYLLKDSGKEIYVMQVASVEDDRYNFTDTSTLCFDSEKDMRSWTIKDAKDGDVLTNDFNLIFIFKEIKNNIYIISHCSIIDRYKDVIVNSMAESAVGDVNLVKCQPATKEQCDLLFQKMKERGYEWDADKKELKKIEQNPAWSEEDENKVTLFMQLTEGCDNEEELSDWLKSLKDRCRPQSKQEWGEEDERKIESISEIIDEKMSTLPKGFNEHYINLISWLKSLRPRKQWKPSEEQLNVLELAISNYENGYTYDI